MQSDNTSSQTNLVDSQPLDDAQFSIIDTLTIWGRDKSLLFGCTLFSALLGLAIALLITPTFTAKAVILPPQQQQQSSAASALTNLGALAGAAGAGAALGNLKTPDELYMALLGTERIQTIIIERFKLQERYDLTYMSDVRKELEKRVKFLSSKKSGLVSIEADDKDPAFAAQMANAHVEELQKLLSTLAVTEAQQRRGFFELEVTKTRDQLSKAEIAFREAQQRSGMQVTAALAETGVRASVELRTQIASREVQLQALRGTYATAQNPEALRIASELAAVRSQLSKLEQGTAGGTSDRAAPVAAAGQDAVRAFRDMKVQEALLEVMVRQYELARVDEAREGPLLQRVDVATAPDKKSKPRRALILLGSLVLGFLWGVSWIYFRQWKRKAGGTGGQLQALRDAWRFGRAAKTR